MLQGIIKDTSVVCYVGTYLFYSTWHIFWELYFHKDKRGNKNKFLIVLYINELAVSFLSSVYLVVCYLLKLTQNLPLPLKPLHLYLGIIVCEK